MATCDQCSGSSGAPRTGDRFSRTVIRAAERVLARGRAARCRIRGGRRPEIAGNPEARLAGVTLSFEHDVGRTAFGHLHLDLVSEFEAAQVVP
jgi:hypothetical protein